jgi:hypothetical protein
LAVGAAEELNRRARLPQAVAADILGLFTQQAALLEDKARNKLAIAGRRGGKTHTIVHAALRAAAAQPNRVVPVAEKTLTCASASAFWSALQSFEARHKLGLDLHNTHRVCTLTNGSVIKLAGADSLDQCDKLRGEKYPLVIIDEAGTFRSHILEYLITECAQPATIDLAGSILAVGTPGPRRVGYWFEMCHSDRWSRHHWTLLDNVSLGPDRAWREAQLAEVRAQNNWTVQHPTYLREYRGEWAEGGGTLVYEAYDPHRHDIDTLPADPGWRYGLSIDFGFEEPCAFLTTATRKDDPLVYVVESEEHAHMTPSVAAEHVVRLRERRNYEWVVGDSGGAGKGYVEELRRTFNVPVLAALKTEKKVNIGFVNGDFAAHSIRVVKPRNPKLIEDLLHLQWDEDHKDVARRMDDHLPDAFLYGIRQWRQYLPDRSRGTWSVPKPGTPGWAELEEEKMLAAALDKTEPQRERYGYSRDDEYSLWRS